MKDLSAKNFGLLIAYILPGTIVLVGVGAFSPTVRGWLTNSSAEGPSIGGFLFVTLASVAAGNDSQRSAVVPTSMQERKR